MKKPNEKFNIRQIQLGLTLTIASSFILSACGPTPGGNTIETPSPTPSSSKVNPNPSSSVSPISPSPTDSNSPSPNTSPSPTIPSPSVNVSVPINGKISFIADGKHVKVMEYHTRNIKTVYEGTEVLKTARLSWNGQAVLFQKGQDKSVYSQDLRITGGSPIKRLDGPLSSPVWWYTDNPYAYTNDIMYIAKKPGDSQDRVYHRHYGKDSDSPCSAGFASSSGLSSIQVSADRIILFEQNGKIMRTDCANPNGNSPIQINAAGSDPRIAYSNNASSGSSLVVYWSQKTGKGDIYSVTFNGQGDTNLTEKDVDSFEGFPVLSPDGRKIAYVSDKNSQNDKKDVWVMDVDGKNPINITNTPDIDEGAPDWSADQDFPLLVNIPGRIAYVSDKNKINFMSLNNHNITTFFQADAGDVITSLKLSWDGSQVLFQTERNPAVRSLVIDEPGRGPIFRLDSPAISPIWLFNPSPYAFTNDIMYITQKEGDSQKAVYHRHYGVDFDKACQTRLGSGGDLSSLHVTADRIVVFERGGKIMRNDCDNLAGSDPLQINSEGSHPRMAYKTGATSGSDKVVYWSEKTGNGDVYSVTLNGKEDTQLTTDSSFDGFPVLSPNADKILFVSGRSGNRDIYLMNADGSNQLNLTNTPNIDESLPDWSSGKEIVQPPSVTPQQSAIPASNWPNYELALYLGAQTDVYTYLSKYRGSFNGPDWNDDGCSVPGSEGPLPSLFNSLPDVIQKYLDPYNGLFVKACIQHDFSYKNISEYAKGRNEAVRKQIDDHWFVQMKQACYDDPLITSNTELLKSCIVAANTYHTAVRERGANAYFNEESNPLRYP